MSTCWKCGEDFEGSGPECESCANGVGSVPSEEQQEKWAAEFKRDFLEVDWTKVETLQDVIAILAAHSVPIYFEKDSPECQKLRKFLKPIDD